MIERGMFWGLLGCALEQIGMCQGFTNAGKRVWCSDYTSISNAGVHFEWDIQWILNPQSVLISARMHKIKFWSSNGHDDGCPGWPSNEVQPFLLNSSEQLYHAFSWLANSHPLHWKEKKTFSHEHFDISKHVSRLHFSCCKCNLYTKYVYLPGTSRKFSIKLM